MSSQHLQHPAFQPVLEFAACDIHIVQKHDVDVKIMAIFGNVDTQGPGCQ
jgi:hypothetical protein